MSRKSTTPKRTPPRRQSRTPGVRRVHISGWVSLEIHEQVVQLADQENVTLSTFLSETMDDYVADVADTPVIVDAPGIRRHPQRFGTERIQIHTHVIEPVYAKITLLAKQRKISPQAVVSEALAERVGADAP